MHPAPARRAGPTPAAEPEQKQLYFQCAQHPGGKSSSGAWSYPMEAALKLQEEGRPVTRCSSRNSCQLFLQFAFCIFFLNPRGDLRSQAPPGKDFHDRS